MSRLRITLKRSLIGQRQDQKETARAIGLRRMNCAVIRPDNPAVRGMVTKIAHLVSLEHIEQGDEAERGS